MTARIYTFSRFQEPDEVYPLTTCDCCDAELYEGDDVVKFDGEVFCSTDCFLEYMDVRTEVLER